MSQRAAGFVEGHVLTCFIIDGQCRERCLTRKMAPKATGWTRPQRAEPQVFLVSLGGVSLLQVVNGILLAWFYIGAAVPPCPPFLRWILVQVTGPLSYPQMRHISHVFWSQLLKQPPVVWTSWPQTLEMEGSRPQWSCLGCFCLFAGDSHNRQFAPEMWQLAFYRGLITGSEEQPLLK